MEDLPIQNAEIESSHELNVDPERLGKVSLLFEDLPAPPDQPPPIIFPQAAERNPKLLLSRKKLRAKIDNYKKQKQVQNPEQVVNSANETSVSEVQFDRRHEAIDETTTNKRMAEGMVAIGEVLKETPSGSSAAVSESIQSQALRPNSHMPTVLKPKPMFSYKKALAAGMATGVVAAFIVIFLYVS